MIVGVVGGGQLARMMIPAAIELGVEIRVLAEADGDGDALVRSHVRATLVRDGADRGRVEVAATYRDRMVRTDRGHRIAERRVEGRWIAGERSILPWFHAPPPGTASTSADDRGI